MRLVQNPGQVKSEGCGGPCTRSCSRRFGSHIQREAAEAQVRLEKFILGQQQAMAADKRRGLCRPPKVKVPQNEITRSGGSESVDGRRKAAAVLAAAQSATPRPFLPGWLA